MTLTLWKPGLAQKILDYWEFHEQNFVRLWVERSDFAERVAQLERNIVEAGEDPVVARNLALRLNRAHEAAAAPLGEQILGWLGQATDPSLHATSERQDPFEAVESRLMQWPTGLKAIDEMTGGGYGLTVFAGAPKLGKSMSAMGAAITAAQAGWTVLYVNAELSPREIHERVMQYVTNAPGGRINPVAINLNLECIHAHTGFTFKDLLARAESAIHLDTDRMVVVLDSINRLAKNDGTRKQGEYHYFRRLDAWGEWARLVVRLSEGRVSVLAVSELNRSMQIKGADLEYAANLVVRHTKGERRNAVNIDVMYSRETQSGSLGEHEIHWRMQRFVRLEGVS